MASRDYRRTIHCMTNRILALAVAGAVPLAALVLASPAAGVAASETQECAVDGTFSRVLGQGDTLAVTVGGSCTSVTASAGLAGSISVSGAGELPAGAAVAVAPGAVVTYTATANRSVDAAIQFTLSSAGGAVASAYAITTPAVEPAAPEEPVVTLDGSSADISWDEPDNGGAAITDYKVQYSINGGSAWTTYADAVTAATVATMPGLDPAENYLFRVAAVNSVGTGPYSASAAPAVMPVAPTGLTAVSASGAVNLSWTSPVGASGITDYKIGYSSNGGGTWTTAPRVASTATTASITNLTPGTYIFRVAATNPAGTGPNSTSSSSVTIAEAVSAPGAPTGVTASISGSTFAVSWTAPSGSVTKYTLQYSTNNGTTWTGVAIHTTAVTAATITSLKTAGTYVFKVAAVNAIGTGEYSAPSAPVEFVPPATVPSAPTKLTASRTNEVITLTWVAPAGTVTGYVAQYSINNGTTWTSLTLPEGIATSAAVTTLKDPGSYLFKVAAVNTGGTGAYSAASTALVIASATETGPAAPKGLAAKAGKTSLTLTWTAPSGVTGITDYKVEYSATGTS